MKRLILTQQQLADAYAVPVKSSIYQYFLGLSDRKEKMIGLIIGEYEFFDDGDIEYKEHDFKEIIVSEETMKAWKLSRKASEQTPLMFTDCYFSLVSLRTLEDLAVGNLAEAAAEPVGTHRPHQLPPLETAVAQVAGTPPGRAAFRPPGHVAARNPVTGDRTADKCGSRETAVCKKALQTGQRNSRTGVRLFPAQSVTLHRIPAARGYAAAGHGYAPTHDVLSRCRQPPSARAGRRPSTTCHAPYSSPPHTAACLQRTGLRRHTGKYNTLRQRPHSGSCGVHTRRYRHRSATPAAATTGKRTKGADIKGSPPRPTR